MFQTATFRAAVVPSESTENTIIDSQKVLFNIWTNSVCPNGAWNLFQICFIVLQPLRWRCVECAIHLERDVREEQHPYIRGTNKQ